MRRQSLTSIPTRYARSILRAVEAQGHDVDALLVHAGIRSDRLHSDSGVPVEQFGRLYQRAMVLLEDEALGLSLGGRMPPGAFRMMCLSVIHCGTLGEIIRRGSAFMDICAGVVLKPALQETRQGVLICLQGVARRSEAEIDAVLASVRPASVRTTLLLWQQLLGWFAGRTPPLQEAWLHFPAPERAALWESTLGVPVAFGKPVSGLLYDSAMLRMPNVQTEHTLELFLRSAPYRLLSPEPTGEALGQRVLAILGDDYARPLPDSATVAERLGISQSTLRRRLHREGTSFQALKDEGRRTAALRLLAGTELSLTEIASQLGFPDNSAFFRVFRRWMGVTPSEFRRSMR